MAVVICTPLYIMYGKVNNSTQARRPANFRNNSYAFGKKADLIMATKYLFTIIIAFSCLRLSAQADTIQLEEVRIADFQLVQQSQSRAVTTLKDSVIRRNAPLLSSLLTSESLIYFKENGPGMVSSASFRGTTAQQTAVIWNGININSLFLGQTDFNTLLTRDFQSISIRPGGGSLMYGSSAIGGTVHLNSELSFTPLNEHIADLSYGHFNTLSGNYQYRNGSKRHSLMLSLSSASSDNDFRIQDSDRRNENGQYWNKSANAALAFKLSEGNEIKFYSQLFHGDRHFSLINPTDNKTRYKDLNSRNLLEWNLRKDKITHNSKLAFLYEQYRFHENMRSDQYFTGQLKTWLGRYNLGYAIAPDMKLDLGAEYTGTNGQGSDIADSNRHTVTATAHFGHQVLKRVFYEAGLRQDFSTPYKSPILYTAGTRISITETYQIRGSVSKNFRAPTFNDLYWHLGGNTGLKAESSEQAEIGQDLKWGRFGFSITAFHNRIRNMIRWIPNGSFSAPANADRVTINGLETSLTVDYQFGRHLLTAHAQYAYTRSTDDSTGYQLIYVPYHKATATVQYDLQRFSARWQQLFNGSVFTQTDNDPGQIVPSYLVSNLDLSYDCLKERQATVGLRLLNLFDKAYESVEGRPFPGIHANLYLIYTF